MGFKLQTFAYFVYIANCTVSRYLGPWYRGFFNVDSVKTGVMNSSKRQTTPWTKSTKKPGPRKKEKGEHFDESKKKELAASDKGSWFDQPSSDISGVSGVSHPSTSREVGASSLKLMASKASTSGLAESDSTSRDESNGNTESLKLTEKLVLN